MPFSYNKSANGTCSSCYTYTHTHTYMWSYVYGIVDAWRYYLFAAVAGIVYAHVACHVVHDANTPSHKRLSICLNVNI